MSESDPTSHTRNFVCDNNLFVSDIGHELGMTALMPCKEALSDNDRASLTYAAQMSCSTQSLPIAAVFVFAAFFGSQNPNDTEDPDVFTRA